MSWRRQAGAVQNRKPPSAPDHNQQKRGDERLLRPLKCCRFSVGRAATGRGKDRVTRRWNRIGIQTQERLPSGGVTLADPVGSACDTYELFSSWAPEFSPG